MASSSSATIRILARPRYGWRTRRRSGTAGGSVPRLDNFADRGLVRHYAVEQWWYAVDGVLRRISGLRVNSVRALGEGAAAQSLQRLIDAVAVGLSVPPTSVSSDRREIADFARRHGREELVTKVVSPGTPIVDNGAEPIHDLHQIGSGWTISTRSRWRQPRPSCQPELSKAFEVRVTYVDGDVFACRVDSTASARTALDWRHYDFDNVAHCPI